MRLSLRLATSLAMFAGYACGATVHASPFSFQGLGDLPDGVFQSRAYAVSADGSVVVGRANSASGKEAFRWTRDGGMEGLGDLPGSAFDSAAYGVSANGSVIVGSGVSNGPKQFRWTADGGMVSLGIPTIAYGVSADGSVVVGQGGGQEGIEATRWTNSGTTFLGDLPGGDFYSESLAVSADGSVVVGRGTSGTIVSNQIEAFVWTSDGGMIGLGDQSSSIFASMALGVSPDGTVVVGLGNVASGSEAFRWTSSEGTVGLGDLPGGVWASVAYGVSADNSIIVGGGYSAAGPEAFLWTETGGMQNLRDILIAGGATGLDGWRLDYARSISADGRTIVGYGRNPLGEEEAWIATIPEPSTWVLAACGLATMLVNVRRLRRAKP